MQSNKCANLHGINDLRYEDAAILECSNDEVILKIKSCGICGSDIPRVFSKGTYHFPTVIGHEFAGEIAFDPDGKLTGKRAAVFPLIPCFKCESCKKGNYATCENYDYYGSRRDGGMSEYLAVKKWNLVFMPDSLSFDEAAMCEPVSVGRHAVSKLKIHEGDTLLISGAGPIGIIAGQWAKSFGAKDVYFFDIDERKTRFAKKFGFKEYKDGIKVSAVLEGTGFSDAIARCLEAVEPSGRIVLMGNPSGDVNLPQKIYWHILRKELCVLGTWNSSYNERINDWKESLSAMDEKKIDVTPLITHRFPLCECNKAFEMMKNKTEFYNKVMLIMNREDETND